MPERSRHTSGEWRAENANPTFVLWFSTGLRLDSVCAVRRSPDIDSAQVEAFFVWIWARSGPVRTSPMWSFAKDEEMDANRLVSARATLGATYVALALHAYTMCVCVCVSVCLCVCVCVLAIVVPPMTGCRHGDITQRLELTPSFFLSEMRECIERHKA